MAVLWKLFALQNRSLHCPPLSIMCFMFLFNIRQRRLANIKGWRTLIALYSPLAELGVGQFFTCLCLQCGFYIVLSVTPSLHRPWYQELTQRGRNVASRCCAYPSPVRAVLLEGKSWSLTLAFLWPTRRVGQGISRFKCLQRWTSADVKLEANMCATQVTNVLLLFFPSPSCNRNLWGA